MLWDFTIQNILIIHIGGIISLFGCRDDLETYCVEMKTLAVQVLQLMANALTMDTKEIRELFGDGTQAMRINYYPPCPQPKLVMGLNPHSCWPYHPSPNQRS